MSLIYLAEYRRLIDLPPAHKTVITRPTCEAYTVSDLDEMCKFCGVVLIHSWGGHFFTHYRFKRPFQWINQNDTPPLPDGFDHLPPVA